MTRSVVLITGTSSGIGAATAVAAARAGHSVIATMRDLEKRAALDDAAGAAGVQLDVQQLDVTEAASVDDRLEYIHSEYGRLDALINNAGAGHVGTIEEESLEDVRDVMEVNFYGVVAVSRAALPLLRASRGRLVTVSSVGGVVGQPFNEAYCAAKFAVEGFMESLAPVAATVGIRVTVVEPGAVATEFVANVGVERLRAGSRTPPTGPRSTRTSPAPRRRSRPTGPRPPRVWPTSSSGCSRTSGRRRACRPRTPRAGSPGSSCRTWTDRPCSRSRAGGSPGSRASRRNAEPGIERASTR